MVSYYTVVQYYPDPIADERINIGVMAFGDGRVRSRFIQDWRRVEQFGGEDISFLHDFARRAEAWEETTLREPLYSTREPDELLDEMAACSSVSLRCR